TADKEFQRAIAINPNYVPARHFYSHYLVFVGRFAEALAESQRVVALDPLDVGMNMHLGWYYYCTRDYEQARAQLHRVIEMNPSFGDPHALLGLVHEQQGHYQDAIEEMQKGLELGGLDQRGRLGHLYAVSGQRGEAQKLLNQLQDESKQKYVS